MNNQANIGATVRVYKNLNRQKAGHPEQWTIQIHVDGKWRVSHYAETVTLRDARAITSEAGARRIQAKGHREVVAKIEGVLSHNCDRCLLLLFDNNAKVVRYNPFRSAHFTVGDSVYTGSDLAYFPSCSPHFLSE